jgi:FKBP-type peptidyl-prolyl cis-trans isomerase FklB
MYLFTPLALAALMLLVGPCVAAEAPGLEQEVDRINYSIGHQIGMDFQRQGIVLDSDAVMLGIQDALSGAEPRLPREDMDRRLVDLKGKITDDMRSAQLQRVKERNEYQERKRAEARAFLEANAKKPGVETRPSGLQYRVIRAGAGVKPGIRDSVTIHYRGRQLDDRVFDSTYEKNTPLTVPVSDMSPGLSEAVQMMQPGAKWEIYIPPDLAYGRVSPFAHQAIIVELELLEIAGGDTAAPAPGPASSQDMQQP